MIELKERFLKMTFFLSIFNWLNDLESIRYSLSSFQKINSHKKKSDQWFSETLLQDEKNLTARYLFKRK